MPDWSLRSKYNELDTSQRVSVVIGNLGGSVLLVAIYPLLTLWGGLLLSGTDLDPSVVMFSITAIALVTLTPFFLYAASLVLTFASLSRETRGILGFLLFIGGAVTILFLFPFLLAQ